MASAGVTSHDTTTPGLVQKTKPETESAGDTEPEGEEEEEVILEGEELFMTLSAEEEAAWGKMMAEKTKSLKDMKERFQQWYEGITRRRMFAYSRARKVNEAFKNRAAFFNELARYMSALETKDAGEDNGERKEEKNGERNDDKVTEGQEVNGGKVFENQRDTIV